MPIYDYRCAECAHTFELYVQSSTVPQCPRCESLRLDKLLSRFAVGHASAASPAPACAMQGPCGSCGDPRGPGACRLDA